MLTGVSTYGYECMRRPKVDTRHLFLSIFHFIIEAGVSQLNPRFDEQLD